MSSNFSIKHSDVFKGGLPVDFCDVFLFELGFNVESRAAFHLEISKWKTEISIFQLFPDCDIRPESFQMEKIVNRDSTKYFLYTFNPIYILIYLLLPYLHTYVYPIYICITGRMHFPNGGNFPPSMALLFPQLPFFRDPMERKGKHH
jgi:hypothetical protein